MSRIRILLVTVGAFLSSVATLAVGAPGALARPAPPGDDGGTLPASTSAPTLLITHSSPVWTFVLVATLTAIVTVAATLLAVQRLRRVSRPVVA